VIDWRENPILRRELLFRLRPQPSHRTVIVLVVVLVFIAVALLYWAALESMRGYEAYRELLTVILVIETLLVAGGAPAATANAISREREQRTWDLLTITLLKPHEVVLGKLLGRTIPLLLFLLLGAPMMLLCVIARPDLLPGAMLGTLSILVTLVFYSTAGLAASCFSRKTVTATVLAYLFAGGWVFGTFILMFLTSLFIPGTNPSDTSFWVAVNPFAVIEPIMVKYTRSPYPPPSNDPLYVLSPWALLVVYSGLTVVLVWVLVSTYRYWAYR